MQSRKVTSEATAPGAELPGDEPVRLLSVDEAREWILASFSPLTPVSTPILDALGMVLGEEITAGSPLPPFSNSAMDGFAVRSSDVQSATPKAPVVLHVTGEAPAGRAIQLVVEPGTSIRIMTGAPVPHGADAVVRFEDTDESNPPGDILSLPSNQIVIKRAVRPGENIRPEGEDVATGEVVLTAGVTLRPAEIALLAALGRGSVAVHRRPKIAILSTGDEVVDAETPIGPGQIRNSNSPMLAALVRRTGGEPIVLGVARDSTTALQAILAEARQSADLILTTGGVSTGDFDFVKHVLMLEGTIDLWQVRIKPGKPLAFGRIDGVPLLGLPGNPVAAAVAFEQFERPAIRKMLGHTDLTIPTVQATLLDRVENHGGNRSFVRVRVEREESGGYVARVAGSQGSGILTSLVRANGLLVIPEDLEVAEAGTILPVQMLDWDLG